MFNDKYQSAYPNSMKSKQNKYNEIYNQAHLGKNYESRENNKTHKGQTIYHGKEKLGKMKSCLDITNQGPEGSGVAYSKG